MTGTPLLQGSPQKILLPRFDTIGDIILLEGFLEALLNKYPEAEIALVVQDVYAQLKSLFPERIKWITTKVNPYKEPDIDDLNSLLNQLSQEYWDVILTTTFNRTYIDESIALKFKHVRNIAIGRETQITRWLKNLWSDLGMSEEALNCEFVPVDEFSRETEKYHQFWEILTGENSLPESSLRVPNNLAKHAEEILSSVGLKDKEFCVSNPAGIATVRIKTWPEDRFAEVITWLERDHNLRTLLTGHVTEKENIEKVASFAKIKGATPLIWLGKDGELPLLAAMTQRAKLYFGNDTGPMHIASAFGVPTVGIFGGGHWPRFVPVGSHSIGLAGELPCFNCEWDCIFDDAPCVKLVGLDDVQKAISLVLKKENIDSNIIYSSYKVSSETAEYIEKAVKKFKGRSEMIHKLESQIQASKIEDIHFGSGFYNYEGGWRWISRKGKLTISKSAFRGSSLIDFELTCGRAEYYEHFPFDVHLYVNNAPFYRLTFNRGEQTQKVQLKIDKIDSDIHILIECDESFVPSQVGINNDNRQLSVRLSNLSINPIKLSETI
jgi:ADP-heptose:LPS heptosyltransferase